MWSFGDRTREISSRRRLMAWAKWGLPMLLACIGCGGSPPAKVAEPETPAAKPAARVEPLAAMDHSEKVTKKPKVGGIPMDAYFDNPLEIVANNAVVAPAGGNTPPANPPATPPADSPKPAVAASGGAGWSEVLPIENLQSEVKKVQNRLKASLQGQGTYNGNYKDISVDGTVLAALAGIAIEHSGDVPWKANAPLIRDFGHELSQAATGLGKDNYEKSKTAFDKLDSVFGGAIPADAPKSVPKRPFAETADRGGVMKRIEKARNHLRDNINTEGKLKAESEAVLHETLIISALGKMVATEGYSSADEKDYQSYADALINGSNEATSAVKDLSFQKFTEAMNKVNKSCDQCHANYGTG